MTAKDVLNELRWRSGRDFAQAEVWVRGRSTEDVRVVHGSEIIALGRSSFDTVTATIPYYKVVRVVYEGRVLFERPSS